MSIDAKSKTPNARFRSRQLARLVGLVFHCRTTLCLGIAATVVFACLHTVSVGGAFPIFKLLLEEEGIRGWVDRTVAGKRLGADLSPPDSDQRISIFAIKKGGPLASKGVKVGDQIWEPTGGDARAYLARIAAADHGASITYQTEASNDVGMPRSPASITLATLDSATLLLQRAASWIPSDVEQDRLRMLVYLMVGLVSVIILANVFRFFGEVLIARAVLTAMMQLRGELYERALHLPMSYFSGRATSDLVGRFVQDIQEIQRGLLTLFSKFIREPLRALFVLGLAIALDWRLTLAILLVTPLIVGIFWRVGQSVKKSNRKLLQAYGRMIGALTASLQDLRVVKAYTAESHERERLRVVDRVVLKQQFKLAKLQAFVSPMMETIAVIVASFLTIWLAGRVLDHQLSMSKFAALGVTLSVLFDPLRKLSDVYVRMQRATAGAERIFSVIDEPTEVELVGGTTELGPLKDAVEFDGVTFTYPGGAAPALTDVTLRIAKGETLAVVGPNGSGKTTLVALVPRLFSPDAGVVRYDGVDLKEASLTSLRQNIGMVTQEAVIFADTFAGNIAYGPDAIDKPRVEEAAQRASAEEFIRSRPGAFEASVAERGSSLSGGQRQRLAIARAIYRDAPILIFDEATSQIDSESEHKIQQALQEFSRDRTTLIVAHRLSTIQFADRIVVMNSGRIIDTGTHAELYTRCDLYRTLCETQFVAEPAASHV